MYKAIKISLKIRGENLKREDLNAIKKALKPDDVGLAHTSIKYDTSKGYLEIFIETSRSIDSLRGTLNDLLRCLKTALNILED